MTYERAGVDYSALDAFKRMCQKEASATREALTPQGLAEAEGTRGESAYLIEADDHFLAHVEEGLGTKNRIADAMQTATGKSYYRNIGIDTVATIVNDLITTGARPVSVAMHAAVGDGKWFEDRTRAEDLAKGFAEGCRQAGAVWGGGETPALKGIVHSETIALAGSAIGLIRPKSRRIKGDVRDGDAIVLLASSGVQTNGLTLCRAIVEKLPQGYLSRMDDGRAIGESLLDASTIYARFVMACQDEAVELHYAAHITGHGWRKLMRLEKPFVYRMTDVGKAPAVFEFLMKAGPIDRREAYATFNMGAGFAIYISEKDVDRCLRIAGATGYTAWLGGKVIKNGNRKAVEIEPSGITFESDELQVR